MIKSNNFVVFDKIVKLCYLANNECAFFDNCVVPSKINHLSLIFFLYFGPLSLVLLWSEGLKLSSKNLENFFNYFL